MFSSRQAVFGPGLRRSQRPKRPAEAGGLLDEPGQRDEPDLALPASASLPPTLRRSAVWPDLFLSAVRVGDLGWAFALLVDRPVRKRLTDRVGVASAEEMEQVDTALRATLELYRHTPLDAVAAREFAAESGPDHRGAGHPASEEHQLAVALVRRAIVGTNVTLGWRRCRVSVTGAMLVGHDYGPRHHRAQSRRHAPAGSRRGRT